MKKILCPTDFSDTANNAVAYAAKLAQATNSELILFNVQSLYQLSPLEAIRGKALPLEAVEEEIESLSVEVSTTFKISCYAEIQPSSTSLSTTIATKAKDFDLVAMGTNGADDLFQLLGGSNAYNAAVKATIPVLLVPEGCGYSSIKSIVYAFDYLSERKLPLTQLLPWRDLLKADLKVLQVMEEAHSQEVDEDLKELQMILQQYAPAASLKFDTIRSSEIGPAINNYILKTAPDMLALCTRSRNMLAQLFHKSVIKNISAISDYPVLIFHE